MSEPDIAKCGSLVVTCKHCGRSMDLSALHLRICKDADELSALRTQIETLKEERDAALVLRDFYKKSKDTAEAAVKDFPRKIEDAFGEGWNTVCMDDEVRTLDAAWRSSYTKRELDQEIGRG